jgi:phosphatidylserine decarboxylase
MNEYTDLKIMFSPSTIINFFEEKHSSPFMNSMLEKHLKEAKEYASCNLGSKFYSSMTWPLTYDEYLVFYRCFFKYVSYNRLESGSMNVEIDNSQEIYDCLCHFYFLLDGVFSENKVVTENISWFRLLGIRISNFFVNDLYSLAVYFCKEKLHARMKSYPKYRIHKSNGSVYKGLQNVGPV